MNGENIIDSIRGLEGIEVGLFLDNNKTVNGTLFSVQKDHLILKINEDYFYFPINQIRAMSKNAKDSRVTNGLSENTQINSVLLEEILQTMKLQWITVNSFNDQTFSGVLSKIAEDHILLIDGEKQYYILKSQIINIYNKQIDEDKLTNLQTNPVNEISENPVDTSNSNGSNLQQNTSFGVPLTPQQKQELTELARKKVSRFMSANLAKMMIEKQLNSKEQNLIENENEEEADVTTITTQITLENDTTEEDVTNTPDIQSSEPQQQIALENEAKPQSDKVTSISPKKEATKKLDKSPFLQELRFNSPLETCTWSGINPDSDNVPSRKKKLEQQSDVVERTEDEVPVDAVSNAEREEQASFELVPVQQVVEEIKEIQEEKPQVTVEQEVYNGETVFENEPIKMLMEDNRRLLECQYYALMKFAERMYHLENQYQTIRKHAEKMYLQLKERSYY